MIACVSTPFLVYLVVTKGGKMGTIRLLRDPHNLSYSRKNNFFGCAARAGYESFYEIHARNKSPYWLVGGGAVHFSTTGILNDTVVAGKVLNKDDVERVVERARKHLYAALSGTIPPNGYDVKRLQAVYWMSDEEKDRLSPEQFAKKIRDRKNDYIRVATPGIRAVALRCTVKRSPFLKTETALRFDKKLFLTSPRNPSIKIPVFGEVDLLDQHSDGGLLITDWKTGSFSHFLQEDLEGNDQMLIYWPGIKILKGEYPRIGYFVSLSVNKYDVDRYQAETLDQERYRVQARIRFEEHFPELVREYDDVWAVLNFLAYPAQTNQERREREDWHPSSAKGRKFGLKHHLEQNRLIPSIGRHCGMCSSRAQCQADNPEDWEQYQHFHKLGNVIDVIPDLTEEWTDPFYQPTIQPTTAQVEAADKTQRKPQLRFFGRSSPLKLHNLKDSEWRELGFYTSKQVTAIGNYMVKIIPVVNGEFCPCKKTKRIPSAFLENARSFDEERREHKRVQLEEGKTPDGEGTNKLKDLYDSRVLRNILRVCPIEGCPFPKLYKEEKEEEKVS
jgi:hypothetical protein